jgi:uncharacterized protein (DUF2062 family)
LGQVLHLRESPERTALAFALGVFIAFFPAYGLHTAMILVCTWRFGLNFAALFLGASLCNPWTMVPFFGLTFWTGALLMSGTEAPSFNWSDLSLAGIYQQILPYALTFAVGGFVLSVIGALLTYPIAYFVINKYRRVIPLINATCDTIPQCRSSAKRND